MTEQQERDALRRKFMDKNIQWDGDCWQIIGVGSIQDGKVYIHLASTTRVRKQRNGNCRLQSCDWVPVEVLEAAA